MTCRKLVVVAEKQKGWRTWRSQNSGVFDNDRVISLIRGYNLATPEDDANDDDDDDGFSLSWDSASGSGAGQLRLAYASASYYLEQDRGWICQ